jgi:hypothetical protein
LHTLLCTAELTSWHADYAATALECARIAQDYLTDVGAEADQVRVLRVLTAAHGLSGQLAEARHAKARLDHLEETLDRKYRTEFPPLKVPLLADSAGKVGGQVVVLECFTSASCRQCDASYLAWDALLKSYKPNELIFLQHHVPHFGADLLANAGAETRWNWYIKAYPKAFQVTPAILLDGSPEPFAGHGHGTPAHKADLYQQARRKYNLYSEVIDRRREVPPVAQLTLRAARQGDRIAIRVEVRGLANAGEGKRLHVVVAEDTIRLAGGNSLRFHRHVVRSLPSGPTGAALLNAASEH